MFARAACAQRLVFWTTRSRKLAREVCPCDDGLLEVQRRSLDDTSAQPSLDPGWLRWLGGMRG